MVPQEQERHLVRFEGVLIHPDSSGRALKLKAPLELLQAQLCLPCLSKF